MTDELDQSEFWNLVSKMMFFCLIFLSCQGIKAIK